MPTARLTETYLQRAERPTEGVIRHWDTEVKGFVAHVRPAATTLYYQRDVRGKTKRVLLGRLGTVKLDAARTMARMHDLEMRNGTAKQLRKQETVTLRMALAKYLDVTTATEQHVAHVKRAIEVRLKAWLERPLEAIKMADVLAMHTRLSNEAPCMADDVMRAYRAVHNVAQIEFEDARLPPCPTLALKKRQGKRGWNNPEAKRNAPITDLRAWREAVERIENPTHRGFYLFGLMTGLRKTEIATLTWDQIDLERRTLRLPKTKNGRPHEIPLNDHHLAILDALPRYRRYVFPDVSGARPVVNPRHEFVPGTLHSMRATWASVGAAIGFGDDQTGRVLNHAHASRTVTNKSYIRLTADDMRPIVDAVTDELARRLNGE